MDWDRDETAQASRLRDRHGVAVEPANARQAAVTARDLLVRRLPGPRRTTVRAHLDRARRIAGAIYRRWQVGPYQWQVKHVRWYLEHGARGLTPSTRYRHWLTLRLLVIALDKEADWTRQLAGAWQRPTGELGSLGTGRPIKRPT
jgi:hypothetical protein